MQLFTSYLFTTTELDDIRIAVNERLNRAENRTEIVRLTNLLNKLFAIYTPEEIRDMESTNEYS